MQNYNYQDKQLSLNYLILLFMISLLPSKWGTEILRDSLKNSDVSKFTVYVVVVCTDIHKTNSTVVSIYIVV